MKQWGKAWSVNIINNRSPHVFTNSKNLRAETIDNLKMGSQSGAQARKLNEEQLYKWSRTLTAVKPWRDLSPGESYEPATLSARDRRDKYAPQ